MDHMPACAWCGLGARDIQGAKFARRNLQTSDGLTRFAFGIHYRDNGGVSCVDEDPHGRTIQSAPTVSGEVFQAIEKRGPGRLLIRHRPEKKRMRIARTSA